MHKKSEWLSSAGHTIFVVCVWFMHLLNENDNKSQTIKSYLRSDHAFAYRMLDWWVKMS